MFLRLSWTGSGGGSLFVFGVAVASWEGMELIAFYGDFLDFLNGF